jgi:hypothetical protein
MTNPSQELLPIVVKDFYKNQIEKALSKYEETGKV